MLRGISNPYKRRASATSSRHASTSDAGSAPPLLKLLVVLGLCLLFLLGNQSHEAKRSLRTAEVEYRVDDPVPTEPSSIDDDAFEADAGLDTDPPTLEPVPTTEPAADDDAYEANDDAYESDVGVEIDPPTLDGVDLDPTESTDDDAFEANSGVETEPPTIESADVDAIERTDEDAFETDSGVETDPSALESTNLDATERTGDDAFEANSGVETEPPTIAFEVGYRIDEIDEPDAHGGMVETDPPKLEAAADDETDHAIALPPPSETSPDGKHSPADFSTANVVSGEPSMRDLLHAKSVQKRDSLRQQLLEREENASVSLPQSPSVEQHHPGQCNESDAFSGIPIDGGTPGNTLGWTPPLDASTKSRYEWEDAYKSAMKRIRESGLGGDDLRNFALSETRALKNLRHRLFCVD